MNIIKPSAQIIYMHGTDLICCGTGIGALRFIEASGRISHRSEDAQTLDSWERFIKAVVLGHGDWSIVEHVSASVDFTVDIGITHELVRHRLLSFTQESSRFVNYEKKMPPSFIRPPLPETVHTDPLCGCAMCQAAAGALESWECGIKLAEDAYRGLLRRGCSPQIARSVLPKALAARIRASGNLRNWRHVLLMRTTKETHPQMREVMDPLLKQFQDCVPLLFDDIEVGARQIDNMRKPR